MSTSEYRSVDAESDLPISAAELAALATQLFAASVRPGPDSPPQATPLSPRGNVPDVTSAASAGTTAAGAANPFTPSAPAIPLTDVYVPAPTSPEPEGIPQTVSRWLRAAMRRIRRPRRRRPTRSRACWTRMPCPTSGIVPTVPGRAGRVGTDGTGGAARLGARLAAGRTDDRRPRLDRTRR